MAVKNYAPELIQLFITASQEEVRIRLDSKREAHRLRFRFHNLRRDMEREKHSLLPIAQRVQLRIENEPDGSAILSCAPADGDFLDQLRAAGIKVEDNLPKAEESAEPSPPTDPKTVASAVEAFMKKG